MRPLCPLLAALLTAALAAQARHPLLGSVVAADGKTVAGARVHFCSTVGEGEQFTAADDLGAVADAKGRFRVDLLVGRDYSGFATGSAAADGSLPVSRVYEDLAPGAPIEFALTLTAHPRQLTVDNAAAWASLCGPLRLRVGPFARSFTGDVLPVGDDGNVALPANAGRTQYAELLDRDGQVLHRSELRTATAAFELLPPQSIPVLAVDDAGKPVAGVEVLHQVAAFHSPDTSLGRWPWRWQFRRGAVTAADGTAAVHVPLRKSPLADDSTAMPMLAQKPGYAEAHSGWDGMPYEDSKQVAVPVTRLRFVMHAEQPLRGQVLDDKGAPLANAWVSVAATCAVMVNDMRPVHQRDWLVRTDRDGRFACGLLPADAQLERIAVAPPTRAAGVLLPEVAPLHPAGLGAVRTVTLSAAAARRIPLRAVTADGTPAAHALVLLVPVCEFEFFAPWPFQARLDAAGRATLQLKDGPWFVCTTDGVGFAAAAVTDETPAAPLELRMQPLTVCHCLVVDADGKPAVGAHCSWFQLGFGSGAAGVQRSRDDQALDEVAQWLAFAAVGAAEVGRDGRATMRFLGRGENFGVHCTFWLGKAVSPKFELVEAPATAPLRLQLAPGK